MTRADISISNSSFLLQAQTQRGSEHGQFFRWSMNMSLHCGSSKPGTKESNSLVVVRTCPRFALKRREAGLQSRGGSWHHGLFSCCLRLAQHADFLGSFFLRVSGLQNSEYTNRQIFTADLFANQNTKRIFCLILHHTFENVRF